MKHLILLFIFFFSVQIYAADRGDFELQRQISIGDGKNAYGKKIYGQGARAVMENVPIKGSTSSSVEQLIKRSIAADKPTALKVGGSMLKRLNSPQAIVGTAVVGGLLTAIGWVMEDGVYVKKVPVNPDEPPYDLEYNVTDYLGKQHSGTTILEVKTKAEAALQAWRKDTRVVNVPIVWARDIKTLPVGSSTSVRAFDYYLGSELWQKPSLSVKKIGDRLNPKIKTVPLTVPLLGAAMLGSQYLDPDPTFDNTRVNTGDYTGVKETYEHDPSGVGDELADAMDDKLRNAKPTGDGSPSFVGDPKYDNGSLGNDRDDSSDRSWNEKGGAATGGSEPEKDPVTGQPTGNQSITLTFPLFCSWASKMCLWYDDWKASDKVYKDHMTKTEEHQTQEKTFWTSVKDWFDWTKDESDTNNEEPQEPDTTVLDRDFDTKFEVNAQCPPNPKIEFPIVGSVELGFNKICDFFSFLKFGVLTASSMLACWIVSSAVRGGE